MSLLPFVACWLFSVGTALAADRVGHAKVDGPIGPATADYISRAIRDSEREGYQCLVISLNTPGGLLDSTKTIVEKFLGSRVPVVVYVEPSGGVAGSAGCFITLAAHVAAMAPATSIGAAHPVQVGGSPFGGESKPDDTMKEKLTNYAVSFIEAIAKERNRNVEWAKSSVKDSAAITASKALELQVIDLIATDLAELLRQIDGREVSGKPLRTAGAEVVSISMSPRESLFQVLWRPEIMFILMLIAIYGIIGELSNPGAILPGILGGVALLLFLYMSAVVPVNIAGLLLVLLAVGLFIAEIFTPTFGLLTVGGAVSFFLGAIMLFEDAGPAFQLSLALIIPTTVLTALFFALFVGAGLKAQRLPVRAGRETMIGKVVPAASHIGASGGKVFIEGELWNAVSDRDIEAGQAVEVAGFDGLTLKVKPKPSR